MDASGMVALTRVSGAAATCTVASKKDPFAELAIIDLAAGESLVLQPRSLAGIVQPSERPVKIVPRWNLGLGALITLQFRYLVFEGPARLVVAAFVVLIGIGTILLALPIAADGPGTVGFDNALFMATSAATVTGLWSTVATTSPLLVRPGDTRFYRLKKP